MTMRLFSWAWGADLPCPTKMVLLALADWSDQNGVSFPSQRRLAKQCGLARPTVNRILGALERDGWISIIPRMHSTGADRSFLYRLNAPIEDRDGSHRAPVAPSGSVYLVAADGRLKVGISREVDKRVRGISTSLGLEVTVIEVFQMDMRSARIVEQRALDLLDPYRLRGEWISCEPMIAIAAIRRAIDEGGVTEGYTPLSSSVTPPVTLDDTFTPRLEPNSSDEEFMVPTARKPSASKRGTRIAADWSLPDEGRVYAIDKGIDPGAVDDLAEQFHNHWLARAGSKGVMLDWAACWRTWVGNDIKWRKERSNGSGTGSPAGQRRADRRENIGNLFEGVVEAVNRRR